jgi:threonine synthase
MKLIANNREDLERYIDAHCSPEESVVLRYRNVFEFGMTDEETSRYKEWLQKVSIREGSRIFPLLCYKGVDISILDETSRMHTKTLKSIDGCITIARSKLNGYDRVFFESGGNTGTALTEYGQRAGLETFFFVPEDNIPLLNSRTCGADKAHLISVKEPGLVKRAAHVLESRNGLKRIPLVAWRYEASMFRGAFILEHMLRRERFDWIAQTISAAFGPIGIYRVLRDFHKEIGEAPRFLGIQQETNCPMYKAWKTKKSFEPVEISSTKQLLTRVMYDSKPHTYGTYKDLTEVLVSTHGDLITANHSEFIDFLAYDFDGKGILDLLRDRGIEITVTEGDVIEKTGLIALAGTLKEIDNRHIARGSKVLCCLTSGMSEADGKATPDLSISSSDDIAKALNNMVFGLKT